MTNLWKKYPHFAAGYQYAVDVERGKVPACELVRQAAKRQLEDCDRQDTGWPFVFDPSAAEEICAYIASLPHVKGRRWVGKRIALEPWQCFKLTTPFGWLYAEDVEDDEGEIVGLRGMRRYRTVYIEVPRKNAKTTIAAGVGLYLLEKDGEPGAEVYSAATTRNQAKIVFNIARQMALRATGLDVMAHNISDLDSASKFEPLHAQGETLDGYNISGAVNDEVHAWKKRAVYEVIETATGARDQPMIWNITTSGDNLEGICYDLRGYLMRILSGAVEDDSFFGVIWTIDHARERAGKKIPGDEWDDPLTWRKANPNWGVSVSPLQVRSLYKKALEVPSNRNTFLKYHLDVWTNSSTAWMDMLAWEACYDSTMNLSDFAGEGTTVGIDLASKIDVNSAAFLFSRLIDGKPHLFAFMRHWLPEEAIKKDKRGIYDGWVRTGHMRKTGGNVIDVDAIEDEFEEIGKEHPISEIAMDPGHNATQFGVDMVKRGYVVIDVRPTVLNFSEAMKYLEAFVIDGRFHHNCPILTWMVSNVVARTDARDNIYPRKENESRKIDGVVAVLLGMNRWLAQEDESTPSGYRLTVA